MSSIVLVSHRKTGPVPASGTHAELLAELKTTATWLLKLIELEWSGTYDNMGQNFWIVSDSLLDTTRKLVSLAEQRASELKCRAPKI
jgi:hypothetical protein